MTSLFEASGPLYGLAANVAPPPLAALCSIAMILGVDWLGLTFLRWLGLGCLDCQPWLRWQSIPTGAALIAVVLYPAALAGVAPRPVLGVLAIAVVLAGLAHASKHIAKLGPFCRWPSQMGSSLKTRRPDVLDLLFWLIVAGFGLLALGPTTNADALDYHVGVALTILNTGAFPFSPEWFTSRLGGSGEILIALGLAIGAEQFGSLLQYSGVLGILAIFRCGWASNDKDCPGPTVRWRKLIALAVVSTPILVPWVASPKPMLLPVAMTTAALMVAVSVISDERSEATEVEQRNAFFLVCLLVMVASVSKMNFMLSGTVVGSVAFFYMIRRRQAIAASAIGIAMGMLIMAPPVVWKHEFFGGTMIEALLTPFPGHWPGTEAFETMLRTYRDSDVVFPLSLVLPSGPGTVTTVLGLGLFLSAFAVGRLKCDAIATVLLAAVVVATLGAILGQQTSRFYLEPYLWLLIATLLQRQPAKEHVIRWITAGIIGQSLLVLVFAGIGVVTLTSGSLSSALREKTLERYVTGYTVMRWADTVLPKDARLIVDPRFIALAPRYAIANDWRSYVSVPSGHSRVYSDAVAKQRPDFMLVTVASGDRPILSAGYATIYAGPFPATLATRNPFNAGAKYDAWILHLDSL